MAVSDADKAGVLNKFFSSVFTRENTTNIPHTGVGEKSGGITLTDVRVTPKAVQDKLSTLNQNNLKKAQWPDQVPPRVLKELSEQWAMPLCILFNKSIESGLIPDDWKVADVTAILKTKNRGGGYNCVCVCVCVCVCAISSLKLTTESAWTELLSRRFQSIVVRGKKVFVLGNVAQWGT